MGQVRLYAVRIHVYTYAFTRGQASGCLQTAGDVWRTANADKRLGVLTLCTQAILIATSLRRSHYKRIYAHLSSVSALTAADKQEASCAGGRDLASIMAARRRQVLEEVYALLGARRSRRSSGMMRIAALFNHGPLCATRWTPRLSVTVTFRILLAWTTEVADGSNVPTVSCRGCGEKRRDVTLHRMQPRLTPLSLSSARSHAESHGGPSSSRREHGRKDEGDQGRRGP